MSASQLIRRDLRNSQITNFSLGNQFSHRCDRFFDRHSWVHTMQVVQIDDVCSQAAQGCLAVGSDATGMSVQLNSIFTPDDAKFRCDAEIVARHRGGGHGFTNKFFIVALPVAHSRVEHRDTGVDSRVKSAQGLAVISRAVPLRKTHATKPQR